jgi:hypothetical protein
MMMKNFCYSCGAPVDLPEFKGPVEHYCSFCVDDRQMIKARSAVQAGVADWFMAWHPGIDRVTAEKRADHYLKAMPHWAE